ncbi:hypothetical protein [Mesobacillus harenae]|uniref:hypothetical protein n=1 Tax=Mesobacillus harenae TaxID=2213203 RepID=UPI0015810EEC|nr:hypothetical protein [Mesobacillus harenae]
MVTAILIPVICIYFYWVTRKEMQVNYKKWLELESIPEEAIVSGKVIEISETKERFYYHRCNHVLLLKVQDGYKIYNVQKLTPLTSHAQFPDVSVGEMVHLYGNWKEDRFRINRIVKNPKADT